MRNWIALLGLAACSLRAETHILAVSGAPGAPEFEKRFAGWSADVAKALPGARTLNAATRESLQAALTALAGQLTPEDNLVLVLIGHGTFDGSVYKFNLRGPDITARDLAGLLDAVPAKQQLVVNTTSASGASIEALRGNGRVVVTATKSGTEKNATIFARYWVAALQDPSADTDKNETVSALEAFRYAEQKTVRHYQDLKRLATEHPRIEGDGGAFVLARFGTAQAAFADPAKRALLNRREEIEKRIEDLKLQKAALPAAEYRKRLTELLVQLARTQEALER
jgi:hypothetical protein